MSQKQAVKLRIPNTFCPPRVENEDRGIDAFRAYDFYFHWMKEYIAGKAEVFLVPCAATKPIYASALHRCVHRKYAQAYGQQRELLVVSEPVVLIRYQDLYDLEDIFLYDFPPKLLHKDARTLFVERLRELLEGKDIVGCLPRHHAHLVRDAVGPEWVNHWDGDLYSMMKNASLLSAQMPQ